MNYFAELKEDYFEDRYCDPLEEQMGNKVNYVFLCTDCLTPFIWKQIQCSNKKCKKSKYKLMLDALIGIEIIDYIGQYFEEGKADANNIEIRNKVFESFCRYNEANKNIEENNIFGKTCDYILKHSNEEKFDILYKHYCNQYNLGNIHKRIAKIKELLSIRFDEFNVLFSEGSYVLAKYINPDNGDIKKNGRSSGDTYLEVSYYSPNFGKVLKVVINKEHINKKTIDDYYNCIGSIFPENRKCDNFLFIRVHRNSELRNVKKAIIGAIDDANIEELLPKINSIFNKYDGNSTLDEFKHMLYFYDYEYQYTSFNSAIERNLDCLENGKELLKTIESVGTPKKGAIPLKKLLSMFEASSEKEALLNSLIPNTDLCDFLKEYIKLNEYFKSFYYDEDPARKKLVMSEKGLCILSKDNSRINFESLSSGEKNLLCILINMIFKTSPSISTVFIDEPEISLHVEWQKQLTDVVIDIMKNRNIQVIMASHSPFLTDANEKNCVFPNFLDNKM